MGTHYIFGDLHHGHKKVSDYLLNEANKTSRKLRVSSTGDWLLYSAVPNGPEDLANHPAIDAYFKGDMKKFKQVEKSWFRKVARDTAKHKDYMRRLKGHASITSIEGNSDENLGKEVEKTTGHSFDEFFGGKNSALEQIKNDIQIRKDGNTTFVYVPHDRRINAQHQEKEYDAIKEEMNKNKLYQRLAKKIKGMKTEHIVVLMHESPRPENWYEGLKVDKRLPTPLRAHYDTLLEKIAEHNPKKDIDVFHGHLHEPDQDYQLQLGDKEINIHNMDIDTVIKFDTDNGKIEKVKTGEKKK